MTSAARKIFDEALALPVEEREELILELQASLDDETLTEEEWGEAWADECDRRMAEHRASGKPLLTLEEVQARLQLIADRATEKQRVR